MSEMARGAREVEINGARRLVWYPLRAKLALEEARTEAEQQGVLSDGTAAVLLLWAGLLHEQPDLAIDEVLGYEVDLGAAAEVCLESMKACTGEVRREDPQKATRRRAAGSRSAEPAAASA